MQEKQKKTEETTAADGKFVYMYSIRQTLVIVSCAYKFCLNFFYSA